MPSTRLICLILILFQWNAVASLIIESTDQQGSKPKTLNKLFLNPAGLRAESGDGLIIYKPEIKTLWILEPERKVYRQITESDLQKLSTEMNAAMNQMSEHMAKLPPEQQAMLSELIKENLPDGIELPSVKKETVKPVTIHTKLAESQKVGSWNCQHYEEKQNGVKVGEVWTTPLNSLFSLRDYMTMIKGLSSFFENLPIAQERADFFELLLSGQDSQSGLSGFPVRDWRYGPDGAISSRWEMTSIKEADLEPSLFAIPAGYQLKPLMEME